MEGDHAGCDPEQACSMILTVGTPGTEESFAARGCYGASPVLEECSPVPPIRLMSAMKSGRWLPAAGSSHSAREQSAGGVQRAALCGAIRRGLACDAPRTAS